MKIDACSVYSGRLGVKDQIEQMGYGTRSSIGDKKHVLRAKKEQTN